METLVKGNVRVLSVPLSPEGAQKPLTLNPFDEQIVVQGLPERAEIVRLGNSWYGKQNSTVVALNQAVPTTVAASAMWNGEQQGGKSYIIDGLGWIPDVSAGAAAMFQLYAQLSLIAVTAALTTADAGVIRGLIAGKVYGGKAVISKTVTVTDNGWIPVGQPCNTAALIANLGYAVWGMVNGLFIVPPGHHINLAITATNATASGKCFYIWHERQIPLP